MQQRIFLSTMVSVFFVLLTNLHPQIVRDGDNTFKNPFYNNPDSGLDHNAGRGIVVAANPDLDGDGKPEIIITSGADGGRVFVFEVDKDDSIVLVWSSKVLTANLSNTPRTVTTGDFDNNGRREIIFPVGFRSTDVDRGIHIYEFTGTDNDYGSEPIKIIRYEDIDSGFANQLAGRTESGLLVKDIDGDGKNEMLFPSRAFRFDLANLYVLEVESGSFDSGNAVIQVEYVYTGMAHSLLNGAGGYVPVGVAVGDIDSDGLNEIVIAGQGLVGPGAGLGFVEIQGQDTYSPGSILSVADFSAFRVKANPLITTINQQPVIYLHGGDTNSGTSRLWILKDIISEKFVTQSNLHEVFSGIGEYGVSDWGDQDHGEGNDGLDLYIGDENQILDIEYNGSGDPALASSYTIHTLDFNLDDFFDHREGLFNDISVFPGMDLDRDGAREIVVSYKGSAQDIFNGKPTSESSVNIFVFEWAGGSSVSLVDITFEMNTGYEFGLNTQPAFIVDGISYYEEPITFNWQPGSQHTVEAATISFVGSICRAEDRFMGWDDGFTNRERQIVVPNADFVYQALYDLYYVFRLHQSEHGSATQSIFHDDSYYHENEIITCEAQADEGYEFSYWRGDDRIAEEEYFFSADNPVDITPGGCLFSITPIFIEASTLVPPSNFTVLADGPIVNLTWNDNSDNETGFRIDRSEDEGQTWQPLISLPANAESYTDENVPLEKRYDYRLRAFNNINHSDWVEYFAITMAAPNNFTATAASGSQINLAWEDISNLEDGYRLERKVGANGNWSVLANLTSDSNWYSDTNLSENNTYYYRLRAYHNSTVETAHYSDPQETNETPHEPECTGVYPDSPFAFTVDLNDDFFVDSRDLDILLEYWNTDGSNHTSYRSPDINSDGMVSVHDLGILLTNWGSIVPVAVELNASFSPNSVVLNWTDVSDSEGGFWVERKRSNQNWMAIASVPANTESYNDANVDSEIEYSYRVKAYADNINDVPYFSCYSNEVSSEAQPEWPKIQGPAIVLKVISKSEMDIDRTVLFLDNQTTVTRAASMVRSIQSLVEKFFIFDRSALENVNSKIEEVRLLRQDQTMAGHIAFEYTPEDFQNNKKVDAILTVHTTAYLQPNLAMYPGWNYYQQGEHPVSMLIPPGDDFNSIDSNKEPVLYIHGVVGSYPYWSIQTDDYDNWQFYYPYDQDIRKSAGLLAVDVEKVKTGRGTGPYKTPIKVVAHSMGGLVARAFIQDQDYHEEFGKFLMLGTPNNGSYMVYRIHYNKFFLGDEIIGLIAGRQFDDQAPAYKQMSPGSSFLTDLNNRPLRRLQSNRRPQDSYLVLGGIKDNLVFSTLHREIQKQDDYVVALSSASLLSSGIPFGVFESSHPEIKKLSNVIGGFLSAAYTSANPSATLGGELLAFWVNETEAVISPNQNRFNTDSGIITMSLPGAQTTWFRISRNGAELSLCPFLPPLPLQTALKLNEGTNSNFFSLKKGAVLPDEIGVNFPPGTYTLRFQNNCTLTPRTFAVLPDILEFRPLRTNTIEAQLSRGALTIINSTTSLKPSITSSQMLLKRQSQYDFFVDSAVDSLVFWLTGKENDATFSNHNLRLVRPDGSEVDSTAARTATDIDFVQNVEAGFVYYYIENPEEGTWSATVNEEVVDPILSAPVIGGLTMEVSFPDSVFVEEDIIDFDLSISEADHCTEILLGAALSYVKTQGSPHENLGDLALIQISDLVYQGEFVAQNPGTYFVAIELSCQSSGNVVQRQTVAPVGVLHATIVGIDNDSDSDTVDPQQQRLLQNYPNPFNPSTSIRFQLSVVSDVSIRIYNILGQEVIELLHERRKAGIHEIIWNGHDRNGLPAVNGIYFIRLETVGFVDVKKMLLVR